MPAKDFKLIEFGYASAEKECAAKPDLLISGFIDLHNVCSTALQSDKFLILGYKGSGKTAVAERLRLVHDKDPQVFITFIDLADFPYATFSQIVRNNVAPEAKYPSAWSWLLLIQLLSSLSNDQSLKPDNPDAFYDTLRALREMGLIPISGIQQLVRTSASRSLKLSVPTFFESSVKTSETEVDIPNYVDNLKRLIVELRSDSRHVIILDGLDEIVTNELAQWASLSALIYETNRLNTLFSERVLQNKIILLCRTDIFELLAGANKNKIRQDSAIELNWFGDPHNPSHSLLVSIADLRASLAFGCETNVFKEFFPKKSLDKPILKTLLEATRHTPRDFLQLLKYIQATCTGNIVTNNNVINGLRTYSTDYFYPEILDELTGYCTPQEAKEFFNLVGSLRSRDFTISQLYSKRDAEQFKITKDKIDIILKVLFECSAIGNVRQVGNKGYLTFRYRNRQATFSTKEPILLHKGLWRALNLPVSRYLGEENS